MTRTNGTGLCAHARTLGVLGLVAVLAACAVPIEPSAASDTTLAAVSVPVSVPITTVLPTTTDVVTTTATPADSTTAVIDTTVVPTTATASTVAPMATVPAATVPAPIDGVLALDLLGFVTVENEHRGGYVRDLFGYPNDPDGDSCDTRAEVLMAESQSLAQVSQPGCTVVEGDWYSLYDGAMYTSAGDLEIDHVVALKEAWDSGAWAWDAATLVAYGNDLTDGRTVRAVSMATNRAKSDKDPSNWIPDVGVCEFLADWVSVKVRWAMTMDQSEFGRIRNLLQGPCVGTTTTAIVARN